MGPDRLSKKQIADCIQTMFNSNSSVTTENLVFFYYNIILYNTPIKKSSLCVLSVNLREHGSLLAVCVCV